MTPINLLYLILGAALLGLGVIASATADRIRGLRVSSRGATPARELAPRRPREFALPASPATDRLRADTILALTTAGYPKAIAIDAVDACLGSERGTIESWTRAAFRRCMRDQAAS